MVAMAFNFEKWIKDYKLSKNTKAALEKEELTELEDLVDITEDIVKDSVALNGLSSAQKIRLKRAVASLNKNVDTKTSVGIRIAQPR